MDDKDTRVSLEHTGDHHLAKISVDKDTKEVSAGFIYGFADNAATSLSVANGKAEGTIVHTGDTHALKVKVNSDGTYTGTYEDERFGGLKIVIADGKVSLLNGELPAAGIEVEGDHHRVNIRRTQDGNLYGEIESLNSKYGTFSLKVENGLVTGSLSHKGAGHSADIEVSNDGRWKASVSAGKGSGKFTLSVEKGKAETKAFAGLKLPF